MDQNEGGVYAMDMNEEVWGVVQCNTCKYWGRMDGIIEFDNKKVIVFICPQCNSIERVKNPEALG